MDYKILEETSFPDGIKSLSSPELTGLAQEVRDLIINTVSKNGGHLASSLGVVELTLALLYCYNPPFDKIIWDVGHQSYAYKILTNRYRKFHTIRQYEGLSGFPKRSESVYDVFGTGHSSTSISAACGFAVSRSLIEKKNNVIAVIGDGSISNGLAYEALNNSGHTNIDFTVVLNDNEMSISKNVGAMSRYLNNLITGKYYNRVRTELLNKVKGFTEKGETLYKFVKKVEESLKNIILPGSIFEELGFRYIGPIDGHNIPALIKTFNNVKNLKGPNILHILTKKGKGYQYAEESPTEFHSSKPFLIESGQTRKSSAISYSGAFGTTMKLLGEKYNDIIGISAAMLDGTGLTEFAEKFPDRFFDVGIAEGHAVTFAAGLAADAKKPYVAIYSTFMQRAVDQVIHDVALQNLPVVFCMDRAGLVGDDGPTHHGVFDISFMNMVPNMTVMAPKDEDELKDLLYTAYFEKGPCSIRYPRGCANGVMNDEFPKRLPIGKWEILRGSEDANIAVIAVGSMVNESLKAFDLIKDSKANPMLINARFIKPLDSELLDWIIMKNIPVLTVEEGSLTGGFGSAVNAYIAGKNKPGRMIRILAIPDRFIEHGKREDLLRQSGIDYQSIADNLKILLHKKDYNGIKAI